MNRKYTISCLNLLFFVIHLRMDCLMAIKLSSVTDVLHKFEGIDPEVLNIFTFNNKPTYKSVEDASEIDITDLDTSDILNCFSTLSYICFQKKIILYLDSLNRVDKINLFGGYVSFVRVSKGILPPITEQFLASRNMMDEKSLGNLLKEIFEDFIENHILRITVPVINTRLDARAARRHCYDFNLIDDRIRESDANEAAGKRSLDPTCYRGDQSMLTLSSTLVMKMLMLLPIILKVIAAKAIFGLVMGIISVLLSKMTVLPLLLSYANNNPHNAASSSYRQGIKPTDMVLTTDNYYGLYYQQEQPSKMPTAFIGTRNVDNNISNSDYAPNFITKDSKWTEDSKFTPPKNTYEAQNKELKYKPRKDRYISMDRNIAVPKISHTETIIKDKNMHGAAEEIDNNTENVTVRNNNLENGTIVRTKLWSISGFARTL